MPIVQPIIRPPAEANSFLLQITTGCSSNTCSFCGAYKGKSFRAKDTKEIFSDIDMQKKHFPNTRKVFLMDGDAMCLSMDKLLPVLEYLNASFPKLTRISSYANGNNFIEKPEDDLKLIFQKKLKLIYMGLESGSQKILDFCTKESTVKSMLNAVKRTSVVGIKSSVIVLLGLGGKEKSKEHVSETIKVLNEMQPRYLSFLSLMLIPGTKMDKDVRNKRISELNSEELLLETFSILKGLDLKKTIFRSDHASNYLALQGRLPDDKERLLNDLRQALSGQKDLRPEFFRVL